MPVRMVARQQRRIEGRPAEIPSSSGGEDDEMCAQQVKGLLEMGLMLHTVACPVRIHGFAVGLVVCP